MNSPVGAERNMRQEKTDGEIMSAILSAIGSRGFVKSQEELASIVGCEINESVQPQKIRVLALELPQVEVRVLTKRSSREKPSNCPSCGKPLKALYAKNLLDKKVIVGLECGRCLYRGTLKMHEKPFGFSATPKTPFSCGFAPFRYEFTMRK